MPPKGVKRRPAAAAAAEAAEAAAEGETEPKAKVPRAAAAAPHADVPVVLEDAKRELLSGLLDREWSEALRPHFEQQYFHKIVHFVAAERTKYTVHPPSDLVFSAFNETPLSKVKVVILGQDPYHEPGQAHGMCFSVRPGVTPPPSLKNMYKELATDIEGFTAPSHGYLLPWAKQGVFLLNATLTVREGHDQANSHAKCGWQLFTDEVIKVLNARAEGIVFLLWGGFAQKKGKIIDRARHRVIESAHPSPLSFRKWQGCRTFSKCNAELRALGRTEIDWALS
eukprot:SRR837773.3529.p2 GENE.SRR837773.3529~~SRR837773.3529.p2  ORF type:complete len:282 (-),score=102.92 SRR837773.3529:9-854(-)